MSGFLKRLARRACLALGMVPAAIVMTASVEGGVVTGLRASGWRRWWASREDVHAQLARAYREMCEALRAAGVEFRLPGPVVVEGLGRAGGGDAD